MMSLAILAAPGAALAEDAPVQTAAAEIGGPAASGFAKSLVVEGIRGELLAAGADKEMAAGSAAFTQIKLSTDVTARKGVAADLLFEAEQGEIVSIAGSGVKTDGEGRSMRARVGELRKGRDRVVLVEVKLAPESGKTSKLKITLRALAEKPNSDALAAAAAPEAMTEISWRVKDCAGGYYGALQDIKGNDALRVSDKWKEASKADPALPKRWLFEPRAERRTRRRRSEPEVTAASPVKNQRAIFNEAGKFVRTATDPALDRDANLGWVLGKVSSDLENYLSQPANPAICTGALGLADYYEKRLDGLSKRGGRLGELAADAKTLAQSRVEAAFTAARELSEDTPGWGAVTPVTAKSITVRADSIANMAASLAELAAIAPEVLAKMREAQVAYEGLILAHEAGIEADGMPEDIRGKLRSAFTALDAAARLEAIHRRHSGVQSAFEGHIKAIRDAHAKHCVCAS